MIRSGLPSRITAVMPASLKPRVRRLPVLPKPQTMTKGSLSRATRLANRRSATAF